MYKTLPLKINYKDRIDLVRKLLKVYSVIFDIKLTNRNLDILTLCIVEDVNGNDFRDIVIQSGLGIDNEQHVNTELHRLRKKGLIYVDNLYKKDNLEHNLQRIKDTLSSNGDLALYLAYGKKKK